MPSPDYMALLSMLNSPMAGGEYDWKTDPALTQTLLATGANLLNPQVGMGQALGHGLMTYQGLASKQAAQKSQMKSQQLRDRIALIGLLMQLKEEGRTAEKESGEKYVSSALGSFYQYPKEYLESMTGEGAPVKDVLAGVIGQHAEPGKAGGLIKSAMEAKGLAPEKPEKKSDFEIKWEQARIAAKTRLKREPSYDEIMAEYQKFAKPPVSRENWEQARKIAAERKAQQLGIPPPLALQFVEPTQDEIAAVYKEVFRAQQGGLFGGLDLGLTPEQVKFLNNLLE